MDRDQSGLGFASTQIQDEGQNGEFPPDRSFAAMSAEPSFPSPRPGPGDSSGGRPRAKLKPVSQTRRRPTSVIAPNAVPPQSPTPTQTPVAGPNANALTDLSGGWRETFESLAIAVLVAILFRGFFCEVFIIPTGSMAPTLMGQHKDLVCSQCGCSFTVNAAERPDNEMVFRQARPGRFTAQATCPNCRHIERGVSDEPVHNGDRILVLRQPYESPELPGSSPPTRWEVVVFRYPENPQQNYIKRLVGMPGEVLAIQGGDILVRPGPDSPEAFDDPPKLDPRTEDPDAYTLARKPLNHLQAMKVLVYDDTLRASALADRPEWRRWRIEDPSRPSNSAEMEPGRYRLDGQREGQVTLTYRHLVPDSSQWRAILEGKDPATPPRPTLITDFLAYNTDNRDTPAWLQPHWVGDLSLSGRFELVGVPNDPQASLSLGLVRAGLVYHVDWRPAAGVIQVFRDNQALGEPIALTLGDGPHDFQWIHFDGELQLLIDGAPVLGEGILTRSGHSIGQAPTQADLAPARIEVRGLEAIVSNLILHRDVYYTRDPQEYDYAGVWNPPRNEGELMDFLGDPARFAVIGLASGLSQPRWVRPGHYLMLGDNSRRSSDSRAWGRRDQLPQGGWTHDLRQTHEVPESLIVGRAFFVYWPHGVPFWPKIRLDLGGRTWVLPFRPYFERMTWIR